MVSNLRKNKTFIAKYVGNDLQKLNIKSEHQEKIDNFVAPTDKVRKTKHFYLSRKIMMLLMSDHQMEGFCVCGEMEDFLQQLP